MAMNLADLIEKAKRLEAIIPELGEDHRRALHSVTPESPDALFDRTMAYVRDTQERDHNARKEYRATLVSAVGQLANDAGLNERDVLFLLRTGLDQIEAEDAKTDDHMARLKASYRRNRRA
jgi:hypothetical protein